MRMTGIRRLATLLVATASLTLSHQATAGILADAVVEAAASPTPLAGGLAQLEVEGKGVITAISGACPSARVLTILGIPVTVNSSTILPAGQSCLSLAVGQKVEVRGMLTLTGGALSVVATTIEIEDETAEVEGEGRVTLLTGACPDLTLTVDGITVTTDALTRYVPGGLGASCDAIRLGTKVKVKAVPAVAPATGYRARLIQIRGHRNFLEGESRITSVSGTCPDLSVFFGSIEVHLNVGTIFHGGTCASLQPGVKAFAKGFRDDGSPVITATDVFIKARHVEGHSIVSSVTGTCPTLALVVGGAAGIHVVTDTSTVFEHGVCTNVVVGTSIKVKGDMLTTDGSVIAEELEIEGQPGGGEHHRGEGLVSGVVGTCPAKTFTINGATVRTDINTVFEDGTCANLVDGRRVEIEAFVDATRVVASKIEFK